MTKPLLTKNRIMAAYAVAILADLIEFPVTAAEMTVVGAPLGEGAAFILDAIVFGIMTKLLGFHWAFLPSFLVEIVPGLDLLPTWAGCVFFVVRQRQKETAIAASPKPINEPPVNSPKRISDQNIIDV